MPHSECRLRRETLKSKVRNENEENSERTLQREDRKACSVNFTPTEYAHFLTMKEESGVPSLSLFIKARVFNETFRVIKVDRSLLNYYQKLTTLYGQFRSVGVNYNQTVVALKSNFTEKKAFAMLAKLEKMTFELAIIGGEIVQLTREFQEKWQHRQ
ncbi:hypothetical protein HMPREF1869_01463 [Bacteroidales bacterium KA00251]|nr:hypothetical protein HMPREF1869_01463 [Bacteroidales bacterium KA00251]